MEFNEKLQQLRKQRGLTQEELAEILYVSRTAISKWESGRGYPGIDSLKEISKFFSITIDDLLSGEKLISIAEKENKSNIQNICDLLFGIVDLMSIMLILLPLYPKPMNDYIYSVPLFVYTDLSSIQQIIYWTMFVALIICGAVKVISIQAKIKKGQKTLTVISIICGVITVLFLAMAREAYAVSTAFVLLLLKGFLFFRKSVL